jgi:hypothetical protein
MHHDYHKSAVATLLCYAITGCEAWKPCRYADLDVPGVGWDYMNNLAVMHAATITRDIRYHLTAQSFIWDWICDDSVRLPVYLLGTNA